MQFDLFTFLASLFNFVVLMVLLRIFLFKRITRAMDEREKKISDRWDEAEDTKARAKDKEEEYEAKMREVEEEQQRIIGEARNEAQQDKEKQLEAAREEVERKRERWLNALEEDKQQLADALEREMAEQTAESVREILKEFAGTELLEMMIRRFGRKLEDAPEDLDQNFDGRSLTVLASEELSDDQQGRLRDALERFNPEQVEFEVDSDLICGIELRAEGEKPSWSFAGRMAQVSRAIERRISGASAA